MVGVPERPRRDRYRFSLRETDIRRHAGLDGLRGIAALIVVIYHFVVSSTGGGEFPYSTEQSSSFWVNLFSFTPMRIFLAGGQAVHIFFVISGFVLAHKWVHARPSFRTYISGRLARLYLPVWPALLLAIAVANLIQHFPTHVDTNPANRVTWSTWLLDASLLPGAGGGLGVLWSLTWEVLFSLVLCAVMALPKVMFHPLSVWLWALVAALGDFINSGMLEYLPMFFVGVSLFGYRGSLLGAKSRNALKRPLSAIVFGCAALVGIVAAYPIAFTNKLFFTLQEFQTLLMPIELLSIFLLLHVVIDHEPLAKFLGSQTFRMLGQISFSLYLTHQSVLHLHNAYFHHLGWLFVPSSLLVAAIFYLFVEKRTHRLARRISRPKGIYVEGIRG